MSQEASLSLLIGDTAAAISSLRRYFSNQFLDQIAASGEQPYEAVRTRPYHYRLFNIEAMIVSDSFLMHSFLISIALDECKAG